MGIKVDIIVVNWNSSKLTLQAIAPYLNYRSSDIFCNVIIVDNASTEDSITFFRNQVNKLIANKENAGFGKACNQAYKECDGDYILLLNPDTVSNLNVLEGLVEFMENNPQYAITGPAQFIESGVQIKSCARFPTFVTALYETLGFSKVLPKIFTPSLQMTDWDHSKSRDVDHVMGSYMLLRKSVLEKTGFMDEDYFMYMEDVDLSKRIALAGYRTYYNKEYFIIHNYGTSGHKIKDKRLFYSLSSRATYWKKHLNKVQYIILTLLSLIVEPFLRVIDSIIKEKEPNIKIIARAYQLYLRKIMH